MKLPGMLLPLLATAYALPAAADPVPVSLADYAFNFPAHGYEIIVTGETGDFREKATNDFIYIRDGGYTIWARTDRLGRADRQKFLEFYNANCERMEKCIIKATGEIELNDELKMIFRIHEAELVKDGNTLAVGAP